VQAKNNRIVYIELLRIVASFMVIVNHTISNLFLEWELSGTWFLSIVYFYLSKPAVPLFLMITGYNLLHRKDSYGKYGKRIGGILLVLVVVSTFYYTV